MSVKSNCEVLISKINSVKQYVEYCEDCIKSAKSNLEDGVIINGAFFGFECVEKLLLDLSSIKNYLRSLYVECTEAIVAEESKKAIESGKTPSGGSSQKTIPLKGDISKYTMNTFN